MIKKQRKYFYKAKYYKKYLMKFNNELAYFKEFAEIIPGGIIQSEIMIF